MHGIDARLARDRRKACTGSPQGSHWIARSNAILWDRNERTTLHGMQRAIDTKAEGGEFHVQSWRTCHDALQVRHLLLSHPNPNPFVKQM